MDLTELLSGLKNIGIDRVEPCISLDGKSTNPSFWSMEKCEEIFPLLKKLGLEVISCHVASEDLNESIPEICRLVKEFGIKQIVVGMPELNEVAIQERAFLYCKIADVLSECGAELLIHNGKPDIAVKIQGRTAYEYMIDVCLGKVGMQFDTGWAARGGENPWNIIKRNQERIKSLHYKDFDMAKDCDIDTYTGTVKILEKFEGVIEAPNWVHGENYLVYNKDGAIYRYDLENKISRKIESGIANCCNNDHVISYDEKHIAVKMEISYGNY